jgi:putative lipoic acid-binding regulatory protein
LVFYNGNGRAPLVGIEVISRVGEFMKLTIESILNPGFQKALATLADSDKIPMDLSFKVAKLLKSLQEEMKSYDELRKKLVDKYADKDDTGQLVVNTSDRGSYHSFSETNSAEFTAKYAELIRTEIDVDSLPSKFLQSGESLGIKAVDLVELLPLFAE